MIKTASYIKYVSAQISDLINLEIFSKTFSFLKKLNSLKKETKNNVKNTHLSMEDFFKKHL